MADFSEAAKITIMHLEGGDKLITDSGGLTKYGISQRAYPDLDIAYLTFDKAVDIFRRDYWDKVRADKLGFELGTHVADAAFNMGQGAAIKILQRALSNVAVDGRIGGKTLAAVDQTNYRELVTMFCVHRITYYQGIRGYDKYGKGWIARVIRLNWLIGDRFEEIALMKVPADVPMTGVEDV